MANLLQGFAPTLTPHNAAAANAAASPPPAGGSAAALNARLRERLEAERVAVEKAAAANAAAAALAAANAEPKRRLSYMIPPPSESNPPPLLALPSSLPPDRTRSKRGNPNPLIILAEDVQLYAEAPSQASPKLPRSARDVIPPLSPVQQEASPRRSADLGKRGRTVSFSLQNKSDQPASPDRSAEASYDNQRKQSFGSTASSVSESATRSRNPYATGSPTVYRSPREKDARPRAHPQHTLGVNALVLDTTTIIDSTHSSKSPGGILYSAGKDGLVAAWELDLPFRKRDAREYNRARWRTEARRRSVKADALNPYATSQDIVEPHRTRSRLRYRPRWADDLEDDTAASKDSGSSAEDESDDMEELASTNQYSYNGRSGTSSTAVPPHRRRQSRHSSISGIDDSGPSTSSPPIPYEDRWQIDREQVVNRVFDDGTFRQSHRYHTDWVNDLLLCNLNQTVVSASSDRTIRAWNPHDSNKSMIPHQIGVHSDYVRCLAHSRESGWLASGGFDKTLKVWDLHETRAEPLLNYSVGHSVYAVGTNAAGTLLACGSPEKVVRLFDPRAAASRTVDDQQQCTARLVGHADNVRAIVLSEDGKYLLSASSDATVKLWSIGMQRCLHTFTHHADSVWALCTSHPSLERFYSGDRLGAICKVDFAGAGDIATEGECVFLAKNRSGRRTASDFTDGINRIVALDDAFVWAASGSSTISRWRDLPTKAERMRVEAEPHYSARDAERDAGQVSRSASSAMASSPRTDNASRPPVPPRRFTGQENSVSFGPEGTSDLRNGITASALDTLFGISPPVKAISQSGAMSHTLEPPGVAKSGFALNGVPLEHLVPMYSSHDLYGIMGGLAGRHELAPANGYSASMVSLHRTASRPITSSSPFGPGFGASPLTQVISRAAMSRSPPATSSLIMTSSGQRRPLMSPRASQQPRSASLLEDPDVDSMGVPTSYRKPAPKSEAYMLAFSDFESRESVLDAVPLRERPDGTIVGRAGLMRAELLNDRRTVLSMDTDGEVAVWDIILGGCIGKFDKTALSRAVLSTTDADARDAGRAMKSTASEKVDEIDVIDFVRLQIEGEAAIPAWCTVETKVGALTIHLEQNRAFDAEVFLDEAGVESITDQKVDQRLNMGKWILRNLLDGYVRETLRRQSLRASVSTSSLASSSSTAPSITTEAGGRRRPSHISLNPGNSLQLGQAALDDATIHDFAMGHGFHPAALATPAATPAVLPHESDLAAHLASPRLLSMSLPPLNKPSLSTIPHSPMGGLASSRPSTPIANRSHLEYFDRPPSQQNDSSTATSTPKAGQAQGINGGSATAFAAVASASSKAGKLSRFKSFGRKEVKKESNITEVPSLAEESMKSQAVIEETTDTLELPQRAHQRKLQHIYEHALHPPPVSETPFIYFKTDLPVILAEDGDDSANWTITYRGPASRLRADYSVVEQALPGWVLDFVLSDVAPHKEGAKIAFVLEPYKGAVAGLAPLPSGNARLSATRMLRMRKACHYVAEKLQLESWRQRQQDSQNAPSDDDNASLHSSTGGHASSSQHMLPEDEVEILCNDQPVPLNITLAACARYCYGRSGDVQLYYRRRLPAATAL